MLVIDGFSKNSNNLFYKTPMSASGWMKKNNIEQGKNKNCTVDAGQNKTELDKKHLHKQMIRSLQLLRNVYILNITCLNTFR